MSEETGEIIELTIVMVSEDDTTPPATSDEQDNSPEPSQTPDPDDSDEQDNSPEPSQTPEQEEQSPAQDEEVMDMSEETGKIIIELTRVMVTEDDTTPPPTSDEQDNSPEPSQTPDPDDSSEPDITPAPRQTSPPPARSISPEPAEPMYETAPDFELPSFDDGTIRLSSYRGKPVVLVFYRTYFCYYCTLQLRELGNNYDKFSVRDVQILAISSDNPDPLTRDLIQNNAPEQFPLLYTSLDPEVPLAYDRYGNVKDSGYLGGAELADPGVFLINAEGQIVWKDLGTRISHSVSAQTILDQIDNLPGS